MPLSQLQLVELRSKMGQYFSTGDIETLCFDMDIPYEDLGGEGLGAKILSLIVYCQHHDRLEELVEQVRTARPKVAWPGAGSAPTATPVSGGKGAGVEIHRGEQVIFEAGGSPQPPKPEKKIIILFLAANPKDTDRLRLDEEVSTIDERLRLSQHRDKFGLEQQWAARTGDILDAMLRYKPDIVHFSGHGSDSGDLMFEDASGAAKPVSAAALGALFEALEGVRCVVMNACWSDKHAGQIARSVDCVIGMARAVSDEAAIGFVAGFYRSLGEGKSVGKAFDLGRAQILLDGGDEQTTPRLKKRAGVNPASVTLAERLSAALDAWR